MKPSLLVREVDECEGERMLFRPGPDGWISLVEIYRGEIFTQDNRNPRMTIAVLTSFPVNG